MEEFDIYKDIRERTDGNVYFGVVGPVRAGKSTFIRSFMQKLVMPRMKDAPEKDRIRGRSIRAQSECDQLSGRTHKAE